MTVRKNPNNDFRKLLQSPIEKAYPRGKELTKEEKRKLSKLENTAARIRRG